MLCFLFNSIGPVPANAQELYLPKPGVMVHLSPPMNPPLLKGIKVYKDNPFKFDFILDQGDASVIPAKAGIQQQEQLKIEANRLIKYFLASVTVPEEDLWVNLSPYEKDRIIPDAFGQTEMGRDLLAQDYLLKQITASLIYPEEQVGKEFWQKIYAQAQKQFGTTNIPVNTFNKVWIVPAKAVVYEGHPEGNMRHPERSEGSQSVAYVVEAKLKVMLEQDYLSLEKNKNMSSPNVVVGDPVTKDTSALGSQIVREIVLPQLEREVNEGKNFAALRQVYHSLILAAWYKQKIKQSILSKVYADKKKVQGLSSPNVLVGDPGKGDIEGIYQQYLKAFKKGVFNYIKEDVIASPEGAKQSVPRKYFSGGVKLGFTPAMISSTNTNLAASLAMTVDPAMLPDNSQAMVISANITAELNKVSIVDIVQLRVSNMKDNIWVGRLVDGKEVIVKTVDPNSPADAEIKNRLINREKDVLLDIQQHMPSISRHVPIVYGYGVIQQDDLKYFPEGQTRPVVGTNYLIQEKVQGVGVNEYVNGLNSLEEIIDVYVQIARLLMIMNKEGVFHQDISNQEIFIDPLSKEIKLVDLEAAVTPRIKPSEDTLGYVKGYIRIFLQHPFWDSMEHREFGQFLISVASADNGKSDVIKIQALIDYIKGVMKVANDGGEPELSWEIIIQNLIKIRNGDKIKVQDKRLELRDIITKLSMERIVEATRLKKMIFLRTYGGLLRELTIERLFYYLIEAQSSQEQIYYDPKTSSISKLEKSLTYQELQEILKRIQNGPLLLSAPLTAAMTSNLKSRRAFLGAVALALASGCATSQKLLQLNGAVPVLKDVEWIFNNEKDIKHGFYQVGEFKSGRPTAVVIHGATNNPSRVIKYLRELEKEGNNIFVYKYTIRDSLDKLAQGFRKGFTQGVYGKGNKSVTVVTFSYGGHIAAEAVFQQLRSGEENIFKKTNMVMVGPVLAGSIESRLTFHSFIGPQLRFIKALDPTGFVDSSYELRPGSETALRFRRDFKDFLRNVGSYGTILGDTDSNYVRTNIKGKQAIGSIGLERAKELEKANVEMIYAYAIGGKFFKGNHTDIIDGTDETVRAVVDIVNAKTMLTKKSPAMNVINQKARVNSPVYISEDSENLEVTVELGKGQTKWIHVNAPDEDPEKLEGQVFYLHRDKESGDIVARTNGQNLGTVTSDRPKVSKPYRGYMMTFSRDKESVVIHFQKESRKDKLNLWVREYAVIGLSGKDAMMSLGISSSLGSEYTFNVSKEFGQKLVFQRQGAISKPKEVLLNEKGVYEKGKFRFSLRNTLDGFIVFTDDPNVQLSLAWQEVAEPQGPVFEDLLTVKGDGGLFAYKQQRRSSAAMNITRRALLGWALAGATGFALRGFGVEVSLGAKAYEENAKKIKTVAGKEGWDRLNAIGELGDLRELVIEDNYRVNQLATRLGLLRKQEYELFKSALALDVKKLSAKEIKEHDKYNAIVTLLSVCFNVDAISGDKQEQEKKALDIEERMGLFVKLFEGSKENPVARQRPDVLVAVWGLLEEKNRDGIGRLVNDYPMVFRHWSVNRHHVDNEAVSEIATRLKAYDPLSKLKNLKAKGVEALSNPQVFMQLRRMLLDVVTIFSARSPISEESLIDIKRYILNVAFSKDEGGIGADYQMTIGYKTAEAKMLGLLGLLAHELGHNIHPLGLKQENLVVTEFIGDVYGYYLVAKVFGKDKVEEYVRFIKDSESAIKRQMFFKRLGYLLRGVDPAKEQHYWARRQLEHIRVALGNNVDWDAFFAATWQIGIDYQDKKLSAEMMSFLDEPQQSVVKGEGFPFDKFIKEIFIRYEKLVGYSLPNNMSVETFSMPADVTGGKVKIDLFKGFGPDKAMGVNLEKGGIDLTSGKLPLEVQGKDVGDEQGDFNIDSVMLEQLQNAPGFIPVIIKVTPLSDLHAFLNIKDQDLKASSTTLAAR